MEPAPAAAPTCHGCACSPEPGPRTAAAPIPSHAMACMEVWGGNEAIENAVSTPGIDAWVYSRPYKNHDGGGDIHYVSMCNAGKIARFVVADVSGHGEIVSAAARTLRGFMRKNINTLDQTRFTRALNEAFQNQGDTGGLFATAMLLTYFAPTDHLIVCNAGHPRAMWYRAKRREWGLLHEENQELSEEPMNLPLGIIEPTAYSQFAVKLGKGDLVLVITDGLTEAVDPAGTQLGEAGLLDIVRGLDASSPQTLVPRLLEQVQEHQRGAPPNDDITLVLLHHNAAQPPGYSMREHLTALAKTIGLVRV